MLSHLSPRQQLGAFASGLIAIVAVAYIGGAAVKPTPEITVTQEAPPVASQAAAAGPPTTVVEPPVATPTEVCVHVAGAVKKPHLAKLPPGSRVQDALDAAGGATEAADLNSINLAAKLEDGTQVYVPTKQEEIPATKEMPDSYKGGPQAQPVKQAANAGPKNAAPGPVSLNTGTQSQLESLPGVGPVTAQKIIAYRQEHGGFSSVDELLAVKGIGPKKLEAMRKWLKL